MDAAEGIEPTDDVRETLLLPRRLSQPCNDAGERVRRPTAFCATDLMVSRKDATPPDPTPSDEVPLLLRRMRKESGSTGDPGALPQLALLFDLSTDGMKKGGVLGPLLGESSSPNVATSSSSLAWRGLLECIPTRML
mmetsp:Transcript_23188/g.42685  ORF Transcript_23188/g.42685 Transcript_23188/m.42685 type:complete len:137 (+) Transcript_23188:738-1148(+)